MVLAAIVVLVGALIFFMGRKDVSIGQRQDQEKEEKNE